MNPILAKYNRRVDAIQSLLCVGLDPILSHVPERFLANEFPLFAFNRWIIEQTAEFTAAYKPNVAFYEARGTQGLRELELTVEFLRREYPEIVTICDAKRGDNSNTNKGYVTAIFDNMGFDAVTLHPYMGREALSPFLKRTDKACIILCRTSNAGAGEFQDLSSEGVPLWQSVAVNVTSGWDVEGSCMLVVGATYPDVVRAVRALAPHATLLVPGVGAQGGDLATVLSAGLDAEGRGLILSSSREIIFSADPAAAARELRDAIHAVKEGMHAAR